jgi:hypothetical protein
MIEIIDRLSVALFPWFLGLYAIAFLSGGVYYLEQRVSRVRDQFPKRTLLARLFGFAALAIGVLAGASTVGHVVFPQSDARLGAAIAVGGGVAFWTHRLRTGLTPGERIRAGALALVCAILALLTLRWIQG